MSLHLLAANAVSELTLLSLRPVKALVRPVAVRIVWSAGKANYLF
jgi:hypothetical protein